MQITNKGPKHQTYKGNKMRRPAFYTLDSKLVWVSDNPAAMGSKKNLNALYLIPRNQATTK